MNKAIKLKDDYYINSNSIVHNKKNLETLLNDMKVKNLYRGRNNGNIILNDNVKNYDFIEIIYSGNTNYLQNNSNTLDTRYIETTAIELACFEYRESEIVIRNHSYNIVGKNIDLIDTNYYVLPVGGTLTRTAGQYIYILAVNGYKII